MDETLKYRIAKWFHKNNSLGFHQIEFSDLTDRVQAAYLMSAEKFLENFKDDFKTQDLH